MLRMSKGRLCDANYAADYAAAVAEIVAARRAPAVAGGGVATVYGVDCVAADGDRGR
jgi:hypothetical protein